MSNADRREILSRVAAGTISPEEAASQLDSLNRTEAAAEPAVRTIRVARHLGSVEIVGDPSVREAVAEGPHRARVEGDTMVFEPDPSIDEGTFIFGFGRNWASDKLLIRVNPGAGLDLQIQAGNCRVRGVEGAIRADVQAGSATIEGFRGPLTLAVQAGSVRASGRLADGESTISCDAGSVNLALERGSSVRIVSRATMGKVELLGDAGAFSNRGGHEATIGEGTALLNVTTNMGSVRISAE
ncbi:MAG TPA: hypothetical protein VIT43_11885 [Candidatus Dormibacteraeota bacterium]